MRLKRPLLLLVVLVFFVSFKMAYADEGDTSASLSFFYSTCIHGDYVAAGVGMRGTGTGTITISGIPVGSTIVKAFLYWAMLDVSEGPNFKNGVFAGTSITGTFIATDDDPCWTGTNTTFVYRADVTTLVTGNGAYSLSGFTTGPDFTTPPCLEGASLVIVFSNPGLALRDIVIFDGADTIDGSVGTVSTIMTGFTASPYPSAKTTYIVADGQDTSGDTTIFNGVILATDTNAVPETTSFEGTDGPLWDTDTYNVSTLVSGGDTSANATVTTIYHGTIECLVHIAQVFSVTTSPTVGGVVVPVNKLELLMPYIGVISVILITITVVVKKLRLIHH